MINSLIKTLFASLCVCAVGVAQAAPITYKIDPNHTFPSFEADHQGGLSLWRGKVESTTGTIVMDVEAETGTVNIEVDMTTINFGHEEMNKSAKEKTLSVDKFPKATYTGTLVNFVNGEPTAVEGTMTLHGVAKPLTLNINQFLCKPHFRTGKEICGADASATFNRAEYGIDHALNLGFLPEVKLLISIEAGAE